ncbi:hypothetical protein AB4084_38055, partial [Lysobacter sp. 2RAB21]
GFAFALPRNRKAKANPPRHQRRSRHQLSPGAAPFFKGGNGGVLDRRVDAAVAAYPTIDHTPTLLPLLLLFPPLKKGGWGD